MTSSGPEKKSSSDNFLVFPFKINLAKFRVVEHLIGYVALVVGKLWPKNDKLIN